MENWTVNTRANAPGGIPGAIGSPPAPGSTGSSGNPGAFGSPELVSDLGLSDVADGADIRGAVNEQRGPSAAPRLSRPLAIALGALVATCVLITLLVHPHGLALSSDQGAAAHPVPLLLGPALVAILLALALPPRPGLTAVTVRAPRRLRGEAIALLALAVLFPLLVPLLPLPEDYVLLKLLMLLLAPCAGLWLLARRGRGPSAAVGAPRSPRALALVPALALGVLASTPPFAPAADGYEWPPLPVLILAATATAITAGLGEEVFYRRLLQTRLEALLGPWAGILAASVVFGVMHLPSHATGPLWAGIAQVIALQGTTGLALGLIWARWRSLTANVLAHVLLNGLSVLLHLVSLIG